MKKYKNIVFDLGEVLFCYRWKEMLMDYGLSEEEAIIMEREIFENPDRLWDMYDLGNVSEEELLQLFSNLYPAHTDAFRWFLDHPELLHVPRPKIWKLVHDLKERGYGIYILSNYPIRFFKRHTEYADFMKDLDGAMVSHMIHKMKPDKAIYEALCNSYELKKEECLFFDDRKINIEASIAFGMDAIQVITEAQFIEELQKLLGKDQGEKTEYSVKSDRWEERRQKGKTGDKYV